MATNFEVETGLLDQYEAQFTDFKSGLQAHAEELENTLVKVLFWGPGEYSKQHYEKRMQIVDHLRGSATANDVFTSELLDDEGPQLLKDLSLRDREELHAQEADLIFILLVSEKQVTGPDSELLSFGHEKRFRDKMWILLPKDWKKAGYLAEGVKAFPEERKKRYTFKQIKDCKRIRSFCDEKIKEVRGQKFMEGQRIQHLLRG